MKVWEIEGRTCSKGPREGIRPGALRSGLSLNGPALPGEPPLHQLIDMAKRENQTAASGFHAESYKTHFADLHLFSIHSWLSPCVVDSAVGV